MLKLKNDRGTIVIEDEVIAGIASVVASNCFGIAEMAAKAQAANQSSLSEEKSAIYAENCDDDTAENAPDPGSWAELIRNNRTEAVVISEILAPPAALRR